MRAPLSDLIVDLVAERPLTGFEIARELDRRHQVVLRGREGALYAALVQMEREGFVEAFREGDRWRYRLPVLVDVGAAEAAR